ncbi:MAG: hypothetical protein JNM69_34975 [Archangium sp.]|nr:hypothetical protein [Archangium sp.]
MRTLLLITLCLVGCRHVPTRDEVVTPTVETASGALADEFIANLQLHPELPAQFTSPAARESFKQGLENDFAIASGVDPRSIGPTLAQALQTMQPTPEQQKVIVQAAAVAASVGVTVVRVGVAVAPTAFEIAKTLVQLPLALLYGLK